MIDWIKKRKEAQSYLEWLRMFGMQETLDIAHCDYVIITHNAIAQMKFELDLKINQLGLIADD